MHATLQAILPVAISMKEAVLEADSFEKGNDSKAPVNLIPMKKLTDVVSDLIIKANIL